MKKILFRFVRIAPLVSLLLLAPLAAAQEEAAPTLYERLGGLAPISVVVSDFIDDMVVDDELNKNPHIDEARKRVPAAYLKYHVTAMVCQATGGPCTYHGRGMEESHAHLKISEGDWDRMVEILVGVLNKHKVPEAEQKELLGVLGTTKADIVMSEGE